MVVTAGADRRGDLAALAALAEPLRRGLFLHVVSSPGPVSRDEAAEALGTTRSAAAFHLDKLAGVGVLEVEYRRPAGRGGPGAGRPAKLYRASERGVAFSVPERRYDLAAAILAEAVDDAAAHSVPVADAVTHAARRVGRAIGTAAAGGRPEDPDGTTVTAARDEDGELVRVAAALAAYGYEPRLALERLTLGNCPFHALTEEHPRLVCRMNLDLIEGVLETTDATRVEARLDPAVGRCCVTITARGPKG